MFCWFDSLENWRLGLHGAPPKHPLWILRLVLSLGMLSRSRFVALLVFCWFVSSGNLRIVSLSTPLKHTPMIHRAVLSFGRTIRSEFSRFLLLLVLFLAIVCGILIMIGNLSLLIPCGSSLRLCSGCWVLISDMAGLD